MASRIVPCLWFDDQAEDAARFYTRVFPDGRIAAVAYYPAAGDNPSGKPPGSVLTIEFEIAGQRFTALNGGPHFTIGPSISFFAQVDSPAEADRLFAPLSEGGKVMMPLAAYPWSERYAWVQDRFGVSWQVIAGRRPPGGARIAPCLMFAGPVRGKAEDAMRFYARLFSGSSIANLERYAAGEGPEGMVKHGRFFLDGQEVLAMDSHVDHASTFNEAISLQAMCEDQGEVDRLWEALASEGGEEGPCGWIKDRFGLSWQVVPASIAHWMAASDVAASERAFRAMLHMKKLDIAALDAAFRGVASP